MAARRTTKKVTRKSSKRVGTSQTKRSMTTKKPPTKRLKKRRSQNVEKGYYPNPRRKGYVLCVVPSVAGLNKGIDPKKTGYWTGLGWDTVKGKSVIYPTLDAAKHEAAHLPRKYRSGLYWSYATETV